MKTYRIRPFALSYCEIDSGIFTYRCNYGKKVKSTSYLWYIEGADKNIIVDTASDAKLRSEFRGIKEGVDIISFEDALATVGLKPEARSWHVACCPPSGPSWSATAGRSASRLAICWGSIPCGTCGTSSCPTLPFARSRLRRTGRA